MSDRAYELMDWRGIEDLVYGEIRNPRELLMPRKVKGGILYQCFFPGAAKVVLVEKKTGKKHQMKMEDEAGFFAGVFAGREPCAHEFLVDGKVMGNPYAFGCLLPGEQVSRYQAGIAETAYHVMGAHAMSADGTEGTSFAVWAPGAARVSVVGDFNGWNGLQNPMEYHEESGIYELFIPGLGPGTVYKYEIRTGDGRTFMRPDPFGNAFAFGEEPVSLVSDSAYRWSDSAWMKKRHRTLDWNEKAVSILECPLSKRARESGEYSYAAFARQIADYVRSMGYTHVELPPVMEYQDEMSGGYHTTGYFAPTCRYGTPADFKGLINTLHREGIGVILDWTPAQFSPDERWLAAWDGTCVYEHLDPRQGVHPVWGTRLFNYGRPGVRSFLLSSAFYWINEFHADGLRLDGCSTILRQDYGRGDGSWVSNIYGGGENLDGIDFLKQLTSAVKRSHPDVLLMLEEGIDWPETTAPAKSGGLGFDFEWNLHFTDDLLRFFGLDSVGKWREQYLLQNAMLTNYTRRPVLSLSRGIGAFDPDIFMDRVEGEGPARAASLRAMYAWMFAHPGKKLMTDGEIFDGGFMRALLELYASEPALYELDDYEKGFEWIRTMDYERASAVFTRCGKKKDDRIVVVCNFSDETLPAAAVGVPEGGKYEELFNTDDEAFGGTGYVNRRERTARAAEADERPFSVRIRLAPRSVSILKRK